MILVDRERHIGIHPRPTSIICVIVDRELLVGVRLALTVLRCSQNTTYLGGTPSQMTGTTPPSCIHLDNRLYILGMALPFFGGITYSYMAFAFFHKVFWALPLGYILGMTPVIHFVLYDPDTKI